MRKKLFIKTDIRAEAKKKKKKKGKCNKVVVL